MTILEYEMDRTAKAREKSEFFERIREESECERHAPKPRRPRPRKPVRLLNPDGTTGEVFQSTAHVASEYGVKVGAVRESIRRGSTMRNGMRFAYVGEPPRQYKTPRRKKVVRLFDGKVIDSLAAVVGFCRSSAEYKMEHQRLTRAMRDGRKYRRWKYAFVA